jgi:RNA polymerase sigma-70 factor (ECF subfamily)
MLDQDMDQAELSNVIARAKARDATAFDLLVEWYGPRLYGYFYRLTGRRTDAEDLLQDLFVRLVGTIAQYEHDGRFEAWLFRIATNLVRDRIRRARTAGGLLGQPMPSDPDEGRRRDPRESADDPPERLEQAEEIDRLDRAIRRLPEQEQTVILLRHFSQMSFREIADLMGTPLGTALARAHRGLARLREFMSEPANPPARRRSDV